MDAEVEGFVQFVAARQRSLQRTAWLLTGDWALAEDLVQAASPSGTPWGSRSPGHDLHGGQVIARRNAGPRAHAPQVASKPGSVT